MYCTACGERLEAGDAFCARCGARRPGRPPAPPPDETADVNPLKRELARAVLATGEWRLGLYQAVHEGLTGLPVELARRDDSCSFGQWLYHGAPRGRRKGPLYDDVRRLHATFHEAAAAVLVQVNAGDLEGARAAMEPGGDYESAAARLVLALLTWLESTAAG